MGKQIVDRKTLSAHHYFCCIRILYLCWKSVKVDGSRRHLWRHQVMIHWRFQNRPQDDHSLLSSATIVPALCKFPEKGRPSCGSMGHRVLHWHAQCRLTQRLALDDKEKSICQKYQSFKKFKCYKCTSSSYCCSSFLARNFPTAQNWSVSAICVCLHGCEYEPVRENVGSTASGAAKLIAVSNLLQDVPWDFILK